MIIFLREFLFNNVHQHIFLRFDERNIFRKNQSLLKIRIGLSNDHIGCFPTGGATSGKS